MDKLKAKLKNLGVTSMPGTSTKAWSGAGHKLGGGDQQAPPANPPPQQRGHAPPLPTRPSAPSSSAQPRMLPATQPHYARSEPPPPVGPAPPPQPTPLSAPPPPPASASQVDPRAEGPGVLPEARGVESSGVLPEAPEAVQAAVTQLASDPHSVEAASTLLRLLGNVVTHPSEAKFRRVRLSNPKIQAAVVDASGGVELLQACGFGIVFERAAPPPTAAQPPGSTAEEQQQQQQQGEEGEEGYAVLPTDADVAPLAAALRLLMPLLPPTCTAPPPSQFQRLPGAMASTGSALAAAPPGTSTAAAAGTSLSGAASSSGASGGSAAAAAKVREWEPPRERRTHVILPASVEDGDVPEWFFQRTGAELKAAFAAAVRRREADQVLMTRTSRERLLARDRPGPQHHAVVKVRLPEGISVQGEFGAGEPCSAVFSWLASTLRDPLQTYDLVMPDRRPLAAAAAPGKPLSVRQAGLVPSVTLLLRWTGHSAIEMKMQPALRGELLKEAAGGGGGRGGA